MYSNYKRPRFTEGSDDDDFKDNGQVELDTKIVFTNGAEKLERTRPTPPSRKRRRFTEESDDEEPLSPRKKAEPFLSKTSLHPLEKAPPKSILKKRTPITRLIRSSPPIDSEFRKVFISNIDAAQPVEDVKKTILKLMKTYDIPCEQTVHLLPPNIGGRRHRGVAWITLEHQDDIDKAIDRLSRTLFGSRVMKAKVHRNPMLSVKTSSMLLESKAQRSDSFSISTLSVRRSGYVPSFLPPSTTIPEWQKKPATPKPASWVTKDSGEGKKIFIWNIDNNKTQAETESFLFQTLAANFGNGAVEKVSPFCKGMKVYAIVKFTSSSYVYKALEIIDGLKFGCKYLGAQLSRQRKSKDLDFNPW